MKWIEKRVLIFALLLFVVYWSILLVPELVRFVFMQTDINILRWFGSDIHIGPGKIKGFKFLGVAFFGAISISAIWFWFTNRKEKWVLSLLAVAMAGQVYFSLRMIDRMRWDRFLAIRIANYPDTDYGKIFSKLHIPKNLKTLNELFQFSMAQLKKNQKHLQMRWKIEDPQMIEAVFLMNFTAGFFSSYGPDMVSSTCIDKTLYDDPLLEADLLESILKPEKGCCTDSAHLFQFLLTKGGIESRLKQDKGHIWNEVMIQGQWFTMDATLNLMVNRPYDQIDFSDNQTTVSMFPHPFTVESGNEFFNPALGGARIAKIMSFLDRSRFPVSYPSVVPYFQR